MSWRRVQVTGLENADDALFCGLEEIDYNDYLKLRNNKALIEDIHIGGGESEVPIPTATFEQAIGEDEMNDEVELQNSNRKRKRKGQKVQQERGTMEEMDSDFKAATSSSSTAKNKREKRKLPSEGDNASNSEEIRRQETKEKFERQEQKKVEKKKVKKDKRNHNDVSNDREEHNDTNEIVKIESDHLVLTSWGSILLPLCLVKSLNSLGYHSPTPIQKMVVPVIMKGASDVVGAAVTGSGKTLAFAIPVVCELLYSWSEIHDTRKPFSMIFTPTRELAMQIASVVKGIVHHEEFKAATGIKRRVEVINIIGGMSEQKQQRELDGGRPAHIIIATPGRLCELLKDTNNVALRDLSKVQTLVIDEADRMIEEGHFDELFRIFTVIKEHESHRAEGRDPYQVRLEAMKGEDYFDDEKDEDGAEEHTKSIWDDDLGVVDDMEMDEYNGVIMMPEHLMTDDERKKPTASSASTGHSQNLTNSSKVIPKKSDRQTLLFSATATKLNDTTSSTLIKKSKQSKKIKSKDHSKSLNSDKLPDHIHKLLQLIGIKKRFQLVDASQKSQNDINRSANDGDKVIDDSSNVNEKDVGETSDEFAVLPTGLTQKELKVTTDEKDTAVYYYLRKISGRTLIFVNAIITAKRLDGLLRSLGFNSRCIHGQLEQKQRFRALETFRSAPIAILVATEVAARGLDIPRVSTVVHYDIARTPQAYIHRSGRTARTNKDGAAVGTTISIVPM